MISSRRYQQLSIFNASRLHSSTERGAIYLRFQMHAEWQHKQQEATLLAAQKIVKLQAARANHT